MKLRIGNSLDETHPANGKIRMVRAGDRLLNSYSYNTLELSMIQSSYPSSKHVTINEIDKFFSRETDPRAATKANMFATLDKNDTHYHTRKIGKPQFKPDIVRNWGAHTDKDETVGIKFKLYTDEAGSAWLDNSRAQVSNILYEFSPDGGENKWYQLYDLPNRVNTRVILPYPTNRLKIRALSNNPDEWLQSIHIKPYIDYKTLPAPLKWLDNTIELDGHNYLSWTKAIQGRGTIVYKIIINGEEKYTTRDLFIRLNDSYTDVVVKAIDAAGNSIEKSL